MTDPLLANYPFTDEIVALAFEAMEARVRSLAPENPCPHCGSTYRLERRTITPDEFEAIRVGDLPLIAAFIHGPGCPPSCPKYRTTEN